MLVIGGMRCGTTSLFGWMSRHPQMRVPSFKEIHFFDLHFNRGLGWYRAFFPLRSALTFDVTPSYMTHPEAPRRASLVCPDARIVAMVRDPVERAWSHYRLRISSGTEHRSFRAAITEELEAGPLAGTGVYHRSAEIPYLRAGCYADQLRGWIDRFGRDALLIVDSHRLFADPGSVLPELTRFLAVGSPDVPFPRANSAPPGVPDMDLLRDLRIHFAQADEHLAELVGTPLSWMNSSKM